MQFFWLLFLGNMFSASIHALDTCATLQTKVMTEKEFIKEINSNHFLKKNHITTNEQPLDQYELQMIIEAKKNENKCYGGRFYPGREVNNFHGKVLVVGGGKLNGTYGENQGKTVLINTRHDEKEISELIKNIESNHWYIDPYNGEEFKTSKERELYVSKLRHKMKLYKNAFKERNHDILSRYYTINIQSDVQPDILGSITCITDMSKIPDNKFTHIEFENVPCDVYLHPDLYVILERITEPGGTISFSITNACRRIILPVIQKTKFGVEYLRNLEGVYAVLESMHPTYHRINLEVKNINK